jgi:hypothetical protein
VIGSGVDLGLLGVVNGTPFGTYCYLRMPEGLRNAGPTFCRMMKTALKD